MNLGLSSGWTKVLEAETGFVIRLQFKSTNFCLLGAFGMEKKSLTQGQEAPQSLPQTRSVVTHRQSADYPQVSPSVTTT